MRKIAIFSILFLLSAASTQASFVILYQDDSFLESGTSIYLLGSSTSEFRLPGEHKHETSKVWAKEAICEIFVQFSKEGTSTQEFNSQVDVCYDAYMTIHAEDYDKASHSWITTVSSWSPDSLLYRKLTKKCWWAETEYGRNALTCETVKDEKARDYPSDCFKNAAPFSCP